MQFSEFAINEKVLENIAKKGWESPTYIQSLVIAPAQEGSDILGGAPTGTGKSGAFLIFLAASHANRTNNMVTIKPGNRTIQIAGCEEKLLIPSIRMSIATNGSVRKALKTVPKMLPSRAMTPNRKAKERRSLPAENPRAR